MRLLAWPRWSATARKLSDVPALATVGMGLLCTNRIHTGASLATYKTFSRCRVLNVATEVITAPVVIATHANALYHATTRLVLELR